MHSSTAIMPHITRATMERSIWFHGSLMTFLATSEETGGQYSLIESVQPQGATSVFHTHREDEAFYVLAGEVAYFIGDRMTDATAGAFLIVPRGIAHAFIVTSATARVLSLFTPGGYEGFFREVGTPALSLTLPPPPVGPPDLALLAAVGAAYGSVMTGPPPVPGTSR